MRANSTELFVLLLLLVTKVMGTKYTWNTLYSIRDGKIYIHLTSNELVALNFSIGGFQDIDKSGYKQAEIDIEDGQVVTPLASPPVNSTLFLIDEDLFAFTSLDAEDSSEDEKDACGNGLLHLVHYDNNQDSWDDVNGLSYMGIEDASFYESSTYLSVFGRSEVYIYGGLCNKDGSISERLISFNYTSKSFSNITTNTKPQPFFGASNLLAPDPQTQLIIGGRSNKGWLNMLQLATWSFDSGWSFQEAEVNKPGVQINSRTNALALPIFKPLANNSDEIIAQYFKVENVLLIGGELLDVPSTPVVAKLDVSKNKWIWLSLNDTDIELEEVLGAATIFNTLVTVHADDYLRTKRSEGLEYKLLLFNADNFKSVQSVKDNTRDIDTTTKHVNNSITKKAILGSVIPFVSIVCIIAAIWLYRRWKKKRDANEKDNSSDYLYGAYYVSANERKISDEWLNPFDNESCSTLDNASMESWVKKRQEFDTSRSKILPQEFNNSHETLSSESVPKIAEGQSERPSEPSSPIKINKTVSFSKATSLSRPGVFRKKPSTTNSSRHSPSHPVSPSAYSTFESNSPSHQRATSESSFDENVDVQILVSSKRRSVLKVVNPDYDSDNQSTSEDSVDRATVDLSSSHLIINSEANKLRQRVPSGEETDD